MLRDRILNGEHGILLYGLTPPRAGKTPDELREIAAKQIERVADLGVDGLILYDIQPETERTAEERPFPFMQTVDPALYAREYLSGLDLPKVVYRCVGKYTPEVFTDWLGQAGTAEPVVFVGAASREQRTELSMERAYALRRETAPDLPLGGVTIPERHMVHRREHRRLLEKTAAGCSYFVSQALYNAEASKNLLSDYYYLCKEQGQSPRPIIFTVTPCGSRKTLQFLKWLGIHFPPWLENDLVHAGDILEKSVEACLVNFREVLEYARDKGMPIGCNVESVAIRKAEIEASVRLTREIKALL